MIRDVGYAGFRTAAVAKAAGVSQGGQLHHFPTKDDLALAAVEYCNALATRKTEENLARFAADDEPIEAIIADSMDYYVAIDDVEISSQNAELRRDIVRAAFRDFERGFRNWSNALVGIGRADIIDLSTSLRGFAIRKWIHRDTGQFKACSNAGSTSMPAATPNQPRPIRRQITFNRGQPRGRTRISNCERK